MRGGGVVGKKRNGATLPEKGGGAQNGPSVGPLVHMVSRHSVCLVVQLLTVFLSSCSLQPLFIWPAVPQASVCHIQLCFHLPFHPFTPPPSICQLSHHPSDCWFVCPHLLPSRHMGLTPSAGPSIHPFLRLSVAHTFVSPVTRQAAESTD